jgi:hypothetical protein
VRLPVILLAGLRRPARPHGPERADHADRPHPAARPRVLHRRLPTTARRQPEPDGRGGAPRLRGDHGDAGREDAVAFVGFDGATFTNAPNTGVVFAGLKPFEERQREGLTATAS